MTMTQAVLITQALSVAMNAIESENEGKYVEAKRKLTEELILEISIKPLITMKQAILITSVLIDGQTVALWQDDIRDNKIIQKGINTLLEIAENHDKNN